MANQKAIDFVYLITQNNVEVMPLSGQGREKTTSSSV